MYQAQQFQGVPLAQQIPAWPPNQAAMINVHPHAPPIQPVMIPHVPPQLQSLMPSFTGFAMLDAMQNSGRNPLRSFFFNVVSRNGWQNPEFHDYVGDLASFTELLINTQRMQPESALQLAAREIGAMHAALLIEANQNDLQQFIDQTAAAALNEALQTFRTQVQPQIRQMQQMAMQPNYAVPQNQYGQRFNGAVGVQQQQGGYGYGGRQMYSTQVQNNNAPMVTTMANGGVFGEALKQNQQRSQVTYGGGLKPKMRRASTHDMNAELAFGPGEEPQVQVWDSKTQAEAEQLKYGKSRGQAFHLRAPMAQTGQPTAQFQPLPGQESTVGQGIHVGNVATVEQTGPIIVNPERPYDHLILEDGTEIKPAHQSGWSVTFSLEHPYRFVYDPTQSFLFHVRRPDGTVYEQVEERNVEMNYMDHELDPKLRENQRKLDQQNSDKEVMVDWQMVGKVRQAGKKPVATIPDSLPEDVQKDLEFSETPKVCEEVLQAHTLAEAQLRVAAMPGIAALFKDGKTPVEYYVDLLTPVLTSHNLIGALKGMETAGGFEEFFLALNEIGDRLDPAVREVIDQRLTATVNQVLKQNIGLSKWSISSFVDDYEELIGLMKSTFQSDSLATQFNGHAPEILQASLSVLAGGCYSQYLKDHAPHKGEDAGQNLLVFRSRVSVTHVPWSYDDLSLHIGSGGMVLPSALPKLHEALVQIFARTEDFPATYAHRYIETADKKLVEVRRGYLGTDAYLLFEASNK